MLSVGHASFHFHLKLDSPPVNARLFVIIVITVNYIPRVLVFTIYFTRGLGMSLTCRFIVSMKIVLIPPSFMFLVTIG